MGIRQIQLEIWPELDLAGFPKNGQMPDLPGPKHKSGTILMVTASDMSNQWRSQRGGAGGQGAQAPTETSPQNFYRV